MRKSEKAVQLTRKRERIGNWSHADKIRAINYEKDLLQYLIQQVRILELQGYAQLRNTLIELGANPKHFPETISSSDAFEEWKEHTLTAVEERIIMINNQLPAL